MQNYIARLYKDDEDMAYNIGFVIKWTKENDAENAGFTISSTLGNVKPVSFKLAETHSHKIDFDELVRIMQCMMGAKEVVIEQDDESDCR